MVERSSGRGSGNEYEVYRVENGRGIRLRMKKRVPWDRIISLILEGHEVFIPCDKRTAYYIRRQLEKRIGELVEVYPVIYMDMEGYMFKLSLVGRVLSILSGESGESRQEEAQ